MGRKDKPPSHYTSPEDFKLRTINSNEAVFTTRKGVIYTKDGDKSKTYEGNIFMNKLHLNGVFSIVIGIIMFLMMFSFILIQGALTLRQGIPFTTVVPVSFLIIGITGLPLSFFIIYGLMINRHMKRIIIFREYPNGYYTGFIPKEHFKRKITGIVNWNDIEKIDLKVTQHTSKVYPRSMIYFNVDTEILRIRILRKDNGVDYINLSEDWKEVILILDNHASHAFTFRAKEQAFVLKNITID